MFCLEVLRELMNAKEQGEHHRLGPLSVLAVDCRSSKVKTKICRNEKEKNAFFIQHIGRQNLSTTELSKN